MPFVKPAPVASAVVTEALAVGDTVIHVKSTAGLLAGMSLLLIEDTIIELTPTTITLTSPSKIPMQAGEMISFTLQTRDPYTLKLLPLAGLNVPDDAFWSRRIRDGSVTVATHTAA